MSEEKIHPKQKLHKYEGILELYFETGMECMGTIFHDNRGNHDGPHWDTKNHPNETMTYRSLAWSIWFGNKMGLYNIRIFNKRNKVVYEGPLTKDKKKMAAEKYRFGYLPKELTVKQWIRFCQKEYRAELWTNELTTALKEQHKLEFDVGEIVYDDLTGKDVVLMNVTFGENNTIGYWVNSDYLEGGRHPWELTKINWQERWKKEQEKIKDEN
jgi:hypothetical protein